MKIKNWLNGKTIKVLDTKRTYREEVARTLDRAADILQFEAGFTTGRECSSDGRVCAIGAIAAAVNVPITKTGNFQYERADSTAMTLRGKAIAAADSVAEGSYMGIVGFNDRQPSSVLGASAVAGRLRTAADDVRQGNITFEVLDEAKITRKGKVVKVLRGWKVTNSRTGQEASYSSWIKV